MALPDLDSITAHIYRAALVPDSWPQVLSSLGATLRGASAVLAVHPLAGGLEWAVSSDIEPGSLERYEARFSSPRTNPYLLLCDRLPVGEPLSAETIAGPDGFAGTDFYQQILRPQNLHHGVVLTLLRDHWSVAGLAFLRSADAGPFEPSELELLRALAPHLQQALQLTRRTEQLARRAETLAQALSVAETGVVIVQADGTATFMNPAAARTVAGGDGLSMLDGRLHVQERQSRARLSTLISMAASAQADSPAERVVSVPRASGRPPYGLVVRRLEQAPGLFGSHPAAAVILIADPDVAPEPSSELLIELYALTPAEASVASLLARGMDLQEAADALQISRHTVKSHVRQIFTKTGTRRQAQLVRFLLQLPTIRLR